MPIKVLKASAGSGKTFRLTNDYVKLLNSGSSHNQILAVTFTNKATEEMKTRIVKELNERAIKKGDKQAFEYLKSILHDYSHFNISTIDKFFQKIVRSMFRELGFSGLYNLVLDKTQLIEDSVDEMRMNLDQYENAYNLLLEHALGKLKEGKDWSFSGELKSLTSMLWKEEFMNLTPDELSLYTYDNVKNFFAECIKKRETILEEWKVLAGNAKKSFEKADLDLKKDSNRGMLARLDTFIKGKINFFTDTQRGNLKLDGVLTKEKYKKYASDLVATGFDKDLAAFAESYSDENLKLYFTINAVVSHAIYLPVIEEIHTLIRNRLQDRNEFLLSEMNHLLAGMIGESDAPFIYEKVGTQIKNYLLDEFQDTSSMQWKNFIPLIGDSVAYGNENLVVGDVKQSIYRWRNSDWKILAHKIKDEYTVNCDEETLEDNWRSVREIVNFNNGFFTKLVKILDNEKKNEEEKIANVYADVVQKINPDRKSPEGGYVNWKVWNEAPKGEKIDFQEEELQALYNDINEVRSKGFSLKDIGVLVRDKKKGVLVSKYLLERGINVISSESLLVSSSNDVRLLIYLLKVLSNKNEDINNFILESLRPTPSGEKSTPRAEESTSNQGNKTSLITEEIRKAAEKPLFEQIEKFIEILKLNEKKESIVYIQAFQDLVFDYNQKHSSDVEGFLSWWELEGKNISIEGGSGVDAVNILTIHKSKGLDFPVVFVPFCEWPLSVNNEVKWFRNKSTEFTNHLPLLPIKITKDLEKTSFKEEYKDEMRYKEIDNLNLIYVALTRPRSALYAYSAPGNNHEIYKWVSAVMSEYPCNNSLDEEQVREYTFGELAYLNVEKQEVEAEPCDCDYASVDYNKDTSKVKLRFLTESSLRQREGNVLHGILQFVKTKEDAPRAINRAVRMGLISSKEVDFVKAELAEIVNNPLASEWYDGIYPVVWNERTIISENNYRPDRIMEKDGELLVVDYKFGEKNNKYYAQLRNYIKLLKEMNKWSNVRGCLYFHETKSLQWV